MRTDQAAFVIPSAAAAISTFRNLSKSKNGSMRFVSLSFAFAGA